MNSNLKIVASIRNHFPCFFEAQEIHNDLELKIYQNVYHIFLKVRFGFVDEGRLSIKSSGQTPKTLRGNELCSRFGWQKLLGGVKKVRIHLYSGQDE